MVIAVAAVLLRGTNAVGTVEEDSRLLRRLEVALREFSLVALFLGFGQVRLPLSHSNDVRAEVAGVEWSDWTVPNVWGCFTARTSTESYSLPLRSDMCV